MLTHLIRPTPVTATLKTFLSHFAEPEPRGVELYLVRVIVKRSGPDQHGAGYESVATLLCREEMCGPDTWLETGVTVEGETHRVITHDSRREWTPDSALTDPNTLAVVLRGWAHQRYAAALRRYTQQLLGQTVLV